MDASESEMLAERYDIISFPTIKWFVITQTHSGNVKSSIINVQNYTGHPSHYMIVRWVGQKSGTHFE